jgi:hypothetical protein
MSHAMESHLLGTHGNVFEAGHQHITLGVQGIGCIICHKLGCSVRATTRRKGSSEKTRKIE